MNKNNPTLKETFFSAYQSYKKRDYKNAEMLCNKILNIDPNHFDSIFLLANLSAINRDFNGAKEFLHRAVKIQPKSTNAYNNLGTAYKELGKYDEAINFYNKTLEIEPNHPNAHYNLGLVFYKLKDLKKAKSYLQKTCEIQKNYAIAFFSLANVHVDLKELEHAISCYQKAIEINPQLFGAHNNLGLVFRELNDFKNAINCYKKVIEIRSDHAGAHHNLALAYKELGKFNEAIASHQEAIKYEPTNSIHYYYLSELKKDILNINLKNKIKKITDDKKSTKRNLAYSHYLLAKYERKEKNYEKELKFLIKGHQNFFESKEEKFKLGIKYCFDDLIQISEGANMSNLDKEKNYKIKPIFIIGVPRCGSTMIEKIIGSGQKFIPMGEETSILENFVNTKILQQQSLNLGKVEEVRNELFEIFKRNGLVSEKYNFTFTDKSLNNFFYLELIKDLYPKTKIINCKRNSLSSIMSIFQNNLIMLAWSHKLENIFKYFDNYFEIITNFEENFPKYIYHIEYEKLVNNPEEESKKLMNFCELPWDKKCLEFYKRKDLISKTTSNVQIREAIYKPASDRYMPYKKLLQKYSKGYSWFN